MKLALNYALNVSGVPESVLTSPDVVQGALSGNTTRVLRGVADAYGMPSWSVDAVIALSGGARPSPRGLAVLLTGDSASTRLAEVLNQFNVSAELQALGLSSEYDTAVSAADVRMLATLLGEAGPAESLQCGELERQQRDALAAQQREIARLRAALAQAEARLAAGADGGAAGRT